MQGVKEIKKQRIEVRGCGPFCCSCKLSVASLSEDAECSNSSPLVRMSSLAHAMVQERLDRMIREKVVDSRNRGREKGRVESTKFVVMVAMDKYSYDPREDFRKSMEEMIISNQIEDAQGLRSLLNCYVSMNAKEYRSVILQVFHEVCSGIFLRC